jgi:hypothetical protein
MASIAARSRNSTSPLAVRGLASLNAYLFFIC